MSEGNVAAEQLRLYIERVERLEEEKKGISDDIRDVYLEAKATGYDPKIMRQIVRLRKMAPHDRQEMQAILETYMAALGMDDGPGRTPDMYPAHDGRPEPARPAPRPDATEAELFETALSLVVEHQKASTAWLQRQMRIGYNQAARLVEQMEARGVVSPPDHVGKRAVLLAPGGGPIPSSAESEGRGAASKRAGKKRLNDEVGAALVSAVKELDSGPYPMSLTTGDGVLLFENKAARDKRASASP